MNIYKNDAYFSALVSNAGSLYVNGNYPLFAAGMAGDIQRYITEAFYVGASVCGFLPDELIANDLSELNAIIQNEFSFVSRLATAILDLRDNDLPITRIYPRLEVWTNRYQDVVNRAQVLLCGDQKLRWTIGATEHCFVAGTLVRTESGTKKIEDILASTYVFTTDGSRRVEKTFEREYSGNLYTIKTEKSSVVCTENHRFLTSHGWIKACDLDVGDKMVAQKNFENEVFAHIAFPYSFNDISASGQIFILCSVASNLLPLSIGNRVESWMAVPIVPIDLKNQTAIDSTIDNKTLFDNGIWFILNMKTVKNPKELFLQLSRMKFSLSLSSCSKPFASVLDTLVGMTKYFLDNAGVEHWIIDKHVRACSITTSSNSFFGRKSTDVSSNNVSNRRDWNFKFFTNIFGGFSLVQLSNDFNDFFVRLFGRKPSNTRFVSTSGRTVALSNSSQIIDIGLKQHSTNRAWDIFKNSRLVSTLWRTKFQRPFSRRKFISLKFSVAEQASSSDSHFLSFDSIVQIDQVYTKKTKVYNLSVEDIPNYLVDNLVTHNCSTCLRLDGKVKRASEWEAANLHPQSPPNEKLLCRGWRCACVLEPTTEPLSRGPLPVLN